jgi:hypothetical protein
MRGFNVVITLVVYIFKQHIRLHFRLRLFYVHFLWNWMTMMNWRWIKNCSKKLKSLEVPKTRISHSNAEWFEQEIKLKIWIWWKCITIVYVNRANIYLGYHKSLIKIWRESNAATNSINFLLALLFFVEAN